MRLYKASRDRAGRTYRKTVAGGLTLGAATAIGLVGLVSPASAAGGGCGLANDQYPVSGGRPWNASACSADDGVYVYGDAYINRAGSTAGGCNVRIAIQDARTLVILRTRNDSCYLGHHPAISVRKEPGRTYRTQLRLNTNLTYVYWTSKVTT